MAELNEKRKVYYIPDNFIDEAKIIQGRFKRRNFIEACVLGGVMALLGLALPITDLKTRIVVVILMAAPLFLLGITGYNGDPITIAIKSAYNWKKNNSVVIYNSKARPLTKDPLQAILDEEQIRDKLVDAYDKIRSNRIARKDSEEYTEGVTFEFLDDRYENPYVDKEAAQRAAESVLSESEENIPDENENNGIEEILEHKELTIDSGDTAEDETPDIDALLDRDATLKNDFDMTSSDTPEDWFG